LMGGTEMKYFGYIWIRHILPYFEYQLFCKQKINQP